LQMGWSFLRPEMNEFLDLLPAQQRLDEATWYRGTADAVYQNFDIFRAAGPEYFIILAGDHIYKMDYSNMLQFHVDKGADCTVACIEVPLEAGANFGVMAVDASMRIVDFLEKPKDPPAIIGRPGRALASMGVYVFSAEFLYAELERDHRDPTSSHDFGKDVIPNLVRRGLAAAHSFEESCVKTTPEAEAYWRDVGTIDAYWSANIDLVMPVPSLDIYDRNWPIWTYQQQFPPAKFVFDDEDRRGMAVDSMVSGGCIISGAMVRRSLLFSNCRVNSYARTTEAVLLPEVQVGRYARLNKVVVDRGCQIPEGLVIGEDSELDAKRFYRSEEGVVLVSADMLTALQ
jgi:glucose-1-phosphate adenylyltransferase